MRVEDVHEHFDGRRCIDELRHDLGAREAHGHLGASVAERYGGLQRHARLRDVVDDDVGELQRIDRRRLGCISESFAIRDFRSARRAGDVHGDSSLPVVALPEAEDVCHSLRLHQRVDRFDEVIPIGDHAAAGIAREHVQRVVLEIVERVAQALDVDRVERDAGRKKSLVHRLHEIEKRRLDVRRTISRFDIRDARRIEPLGEEDEMLLAFERCEAGRDVAKVVELRFDELVFRDGEHVLIGLTAAKRVRHLAADHIREPFLRIGNGLPLLHRRHPLRALLAAEREAERVLRLAAVQREDGAGDGHAIADERRKKMNAAAGGVGCHGEKIGGRIRM